MKPFKNLDEQIKILEKRNLKFLDKGKTKKYLLIYNYYNIINAYSKFFINPKNGSYYNDVYFEDILEIHHFDKELKDIIFKSIIEAERHIKSILAYCYCKHFKKDLYSYLNIQNYNKNENLIKISKQISNLINTINKYKNKRYNNSIKHYLNEHNNIPLWVLIEYLTLGDIVNFYKILPDKIKNDIAKHLSMFLEDNLKKKITNEIHFNIIQKSLENITELRNITAHNNMILSYKFKNDLPYFYDIHAPLNILKTDNRQNVYNTILFLKIFLNNNEYSKINNTIRKRMKILKNKIKNDKYTKNIFDSLGLPENMEKLQIKT